MAVDRAAIAERLLPWFEKHGRHALPWQNPPSPYRVWVSEIMLQQTQVNTVVPYFQRFTAKYPDLPSLACADQDAVLALWAGLGYYARARNLHAAAQLCRERYGGKLPDQFEQLKALPGIGRSTAGAIMALAYNQPYAILDGNARRVLARFHAIEGAVSRADVQHCLWAAAEAATPHDFAARYTQAIMDLGATVCTRSKPSCAICPLRGQCRAFSQSNPEAYPERAGRRRRPHRRTVMLIARDRCGRVLLQRRPPAGIWGGLWSLPELGSTEDPVTAARAALGITLADCRTGAPLRHGFTHYTLDIHPVCARAGDMANRIMERRDLCWHSADSLETVGLPAPVQTLLKNHLDPCHEPSTASS